MHLTYRMMTLDSCKCFKI